MNDYNQIKDIELVLIVNQSAPMSGTVCPCCWWWAPKTDPKPIANNQMRQSPRTCLWQWMLMGALSFGDICNSKGIRHRCHRRNTALRAQTKVRWKSQQTWISTSGTTEGKWFKVTDTKCLQCSGSSNLPFVSKLQTDTAEWSAVIVFELWSLIYCWC